MERLKATLLRLAIYRGYIPLRSASHALRDLGRRLRGVKRPVRLGTLPSVSWSDVCSARGVRFRETQKADGNVNLMELAVLNALCRSGHSRVVFEIGTFDGRTTLNLALNSDGDVFTLDLPANHTTRFEVVGADNRYVNKPASGARFTSGPNSQLPCVRRITQLLGDSAAFDFSPWHGRADFVFVDGAHSFDFVVNDSRVALQLLRPEGGVIVWHDYGVWPDVARALGELQERHADLPLRHIRGTSLVVCQRGRTGLGS